MRTEKQVEVDGARLNCLMEGPAGEAPCVLFSNSLATDLSVWDAQAAALKDRFRVLRYDQRGHGRSSVSSLPVEFDRLGSDLLAVLDGFGIERCNAVGLSMGVPTVLSAHARAPGRFERLVFVDGMARNGPNAMAQWGERIALARREGMDRTADATVGRWLQPAARQGLLARRLRDMIAATPLDGFAQCAGALQEYDQTEALARVDVPLLAVAGANDGAIAETMGKVFGPLPAAKLEVIRDAGHLPNFEQPERFNAVLLPFLADGR